MAHNFPVEHPSMKISHQSLKGLIAIGCVSNTSLGSEHKREWQEIFPKRPLLLRSLNEYLLFAFSGLNAVPWTCQQVC